MSELAFDPSFAGFLIVFTGLFLTFSAMTFMEDESSVAWVHWPEGQLGHAVSERHDDRGQQRHEHRRHHKVQIVNATKGTYGVSLSPDQSGLTYIDEHQIKRLAPNEWTATWLIGFGSLVNPGERAKIAVDPTSLSPRLGSSQEFFIELTTGGGATLRLRRVTPATLVAFFDTP